MGGDRDGEWNVCNYIVSWFLAVYISEIFTVTLSIYCLLLTSDTFTKYRKSKSNTRGYKGCLLACKDDGGKFVLCTNWGSHVWGRNCLIVLSDIYLYLIIRSWLNVKCLQLSMWRCNDELRSRADELHRSSKKDAKHYIGTYE
jgi:hypothetical protein